MKLRYRMTCQEYLLGNPMVRDKKEFSAKSDKEARIKARRFTQKMTENGSTMGKKYRLVGLVRIVKPASKEKVRRISLS